MWFNLRKNGNVVMVYQLKFLIKQPNREAPIGRNFDRQRGRVREGVELNGRC